MKRLLALLVGFLLFPVLVEAQGWIRYYPPGGGFSGGTVSTPILFPDGTAAAPSIAWASDADGSGTGFFRASANTTAWSQNGTAWGRFGAGIFAAGSSGSFGFTTSLATDSADTFFTREGAAHFQLGADNASGAAVDQTLSAADAITAADISGGDLTIQSGAGMGTGTASTLIFQTPSLAAAGANPQSLSTRLTIGNGTAVFTTTVQAAASNFAFISAARGSLGTNADGVWGFLDNAATSFGRLALGGYTDDHPAIAKSATVAGKSQGVIIQHADGVAPVFADLGAATNGSMIYCSDCTIANPCAGSGTGAIAKRLNGVWVCN